MQTVGACRVVAVVRASAATTLGVVRRRVPTYVVAGGRTVTELTTGPDSAYLIVAPRRAGVHGELAAAVRRR